MDPTSPIYDMNSPHADFFQTFDTEVFNGDASNFMPGSVSGGTSPFSQNGYVPYAMASNAADYYPSPDEEVPSPVMMNMPPLNMDGSPMLATQMLAANDRGNPGSFSSVASSATAVSYAGADVEIKEEMSPVSMVTPAADAVADADTKAASPVVEGASGPPTGAPAAKAPAKRKRENRYKNAPPAVLSRRRAQNRASQRAYRERKDQRIRDLEAQLARALQEVESCKAQMGSMHSHMLTIRMQYVQNTGLQLGPPPVTFINGVPMAMPPQPPMVQGPPMPPAHNGVNMMPPQQMDASMFHQPPPPPPPNFMPPQPPNQGFP